MVKKNNKLADLIFIAAEDYISAEILAKNSHPILCEIVNWHCQQAVEKWLKCFLMMKDVDPPYIHDLAELCNLCKDIDASFTTIKDACNQLADVGTKVRYDRGLGLTEEDMHHALTLVNQIHDFFREKYPVIITLPEQDAKDY
jgi:HEPN domain-containing protein